MINNNRREKKEEDRQINKQKDRDEGHNIEMKGSGERERKLGII